MADNNGYEIDKEICLLQEETRVIDTLREQTGNDIKALIEERIEERDDIFKMRVNVIVASCYSAGYNQKVSSFSAKFNKALGLLEEELTRTVRAIHGLQKLSQEEYADTCCETDGTEDPESLTNVY
jgi:hypothetical protein|tara:strand:+ start:134 stop:511 length:378 start_codon:yes stop_codon:yes gene_type:complete